MAAAVDPSGRAPGGPARRVRRRASDADRLHLGHRLGHVDDDARALVPRSPTATTARSPWPTRSIAADGIHSAARAQRYPDEGAAALERIAALARPRRDRAGARRAARWCGPGIATRSSSATRSPTCPTVVSSSTSSPSCGGPTSDLGEVGGLEPARRASTTSCPSSSDWEFDWLDVPAIIRCRAGDVRLPDDRPRPGAPLDVRPHDAAR